MKFITSLLLTVGLVLSLREQIATAYNVWEWVWFSITVVCTLAAIGVLIRVIDEPKQKDNGQD